jgi:Yip1 domain
MSMMRSSVSIPEMIQQSRDVMTNPAVATFERYERQGTMANAAIYVAVGAAISGVLSLITGGIGGLVIGVLAGIIGFFVFTGLVYFLGQAIAGGTGSFDEVAYTFSLFSVPLTVIGAVIGLVLGLLAFIPIINILAGLAALLIGLLMLVIQAYFAYLAVQSSMNIHDQTKAIITLALAVVGAFLVQAIIGGTIGAMFVMTNLPNG